MATSTAKAAASSAAASTGTGPVYKASFTEYGSQDTWGSGSCNVATTACGFYTTGSTAYSAAVSQNEFGVGPVCTMFAASPFHSANVSTFRVLVLVGLVVPAGSSPSRLTAPEKLFPMLVTALSFRLPTSARLLATLFAPKTLFLAPTRMERT